MSCFGCVPQLPLVVAVLFSTDEEHPTWIQVENDTRLGTMQYLEPGVYNTCTGIGDFNFIYDRSAEEKGKPRNKCIESFVSRDYLDPIGGSIFGNVLLIRDDGNAIVNMEQTDLDSIKQKK